MKNLNELNPYRIKKGAMASQEGQKGAFLIRTAIGKGAYVIADDGAETGWEHISAHVVYRTAGKKMKRRTPSWDEMCQIKELFFMDDECVIQFHPKKKDYVNEHPHVLHLWRQTSGEFPMPPIECV